MLVKKTECFKIKKFFLIAEIGINHGGSIKKALKLIDAAKESGANAVKFQTYTTESRVPRKHPAFGILKKCELNFIEFEKIKKYCDKKKIIFFSTPFDIDSVNFLNELNVGLFKISSFDINNYELINSILEKKKYTIISTGMANLSSIKKINAVFNNKKIPHAMLHCISSYPLDEKKSRLNNMIYMKQKFNCDIGLSDHTKDIKTSIYSFLLGGKIIEKHFMLSKNDNCVDSSVSIIPEQMKSLKNQLSNINEILGEIKFGVKPNEKKALSFIRKKIYA
jgi:sialic acid synthase SpsE